MTYYKSNFPEFTSSFLSLRISENLKILKSGFKCSDLDKLKDEINFINELAKKDIDSKDLN
jgi:hypothetical protein